MLKLLKPALASIITTVACAPNDAYLLEGEERQLVEDLLTEEKIIRPLVREIYRDSFFSFKRDGQVVSSIEDKEAFVDETGELIHNYFETDRLYVRDELHSPFQHEEVTINGRNNVVANVIVLSRAQKEYWTVDLLLHEAGHETGHDLHNAGKPHPRDYDNETTGDVEADLIEYARETNDAAYGIDFAAERAYRLALYDMYFWKDDLLAGDQATYEKAMELFGSPELYTEYRAGVWQQSLGEIGVPQDRIDALAVSEVLTEVQQELVDAYWERGERERREAEEARREMRPGLRL